MGNQETRSLTYEICSVFCSVGERRPAHSKIIYFCFFPRQQAHGRCAGGIGCGRRIRQQVLASSKSSSADDSRVSSRATQKRKKKFGVGVILRERVGEGAVEEDPTDVPNAPILTPSHGLLAVLGGGLKGSDPGQAHPVPTAVSKPSGSVHTVMKRTLLAAVPVDGAASHACSEFEAGRGN